MHTGSTSTLHNEQKQDKMYKILASQICHGNKNSFKSVTISTSIILQKHQYVHGLQHDITIAPHSLVPNMLHEFHGSKGHQGTICTSEAIRRCYWWPILQQDIFKYIGKSSAKNLPNMARYPQQHLQIPQMPMAVLAMNTIGCLPIISKVSRWALTAICLHMSYVFPVVMKEKSTERDFL